MIGGGEGEQDKLDVGMVSLQSMESIQLDDATEDTPPTGVPGRGYFGMTGDPLTAGWLDDDDEVSLHGDTTYGDDAEVSLHGDLRFHVQEDDPEATLLRAKIDAPPQPVVIRQMRTIAVEASAAEVVTASRVQWGMVFAVVGGFAVMLTTIVALLLLLAR